MTITAFGSLFLPLILFVFLFRRGWLLPLLMVSAVLQSPAVAVVGLSGVGYGVTPFLAVSLLVAVDFAWRLRHGYGSVWPDRAPLRRLLLAWLVFGAICILGALVLPWVFRGVTVVDPLDKAGISAGWSPLAWSLNHLAQVVNLGLILVALAWVVQQRAVPGMHRRLWAGVVLALLVSLAIGLQQRLGWNGLVSLWDGFWISNPTYDQHYLTWAGKVRRVSWPFVNPTYGSAWYAAVLGGFAAVFLAGLRRNRALLGALLALFALGNSLGGVGMFTVLAWGGLAFCVTVAVFVRVPAWRGGLVYRSVLAALVCLCLGMAVRLVLLRDGFIDDALSAMHGTLENWGHHLFSVERSGADAHAIALFRDSWGLGVGMGSNRALSFVATLLGNTGLLGTLAFFVAFALQLRLLAGEALRGSALAVFFLGSSVAALIAMAVAIPDQNWPVLWILLLGGLACVAQAPASGDSAAGVADTVAGGGEAAAGREG